MPQWLRFLRGIVDSSDLPLNISRETLQHNQILAKVKQSIVKRVLSELNKKLSDDKESYVKFWENFGAVLKEGLCESSSDQEKILDLCLFKSSKHGKLITLQEYVDDMQPGQDAIYYISGDDNASLANHPQLEKFKDKKVDVLLFTDAVDNFWVNVLNKYKDTDLKSVTRANIDLDKINSEEDFRSVTIPKVVFRPDQRLLYMSRSPIPGNKNKDFKKSWRQICVYAFPKKALIKFSKQNQIQFW